MIRYRTIGLILIGIALLLSISLFIFKIQVDKLTDMLMEQAGGTCIQNGKCLHNQSDFPTYIGLIAVFITISLGIYLILSDRTQQYINKTHQEIVQTLHETKETQNKDEKFEFLLKALNDEEKRIMRAVKEQDGIEQATLRIRTDMSKTKLSVVLTELEKKGLVKKVPDGKKNRIYLKSVF